MLAHADLLDWLRGNQWLVQNGHLPKAHAVMGDPPYFLGSISKRFGGKSAAPAQFGKDGAFQRQSRGFMGKTWDGFDDVWQYQAWVTEWASLLLDYVHPGAILAMFGGTRTYHRLAAGLEDAGWEVFDCMMYVYGCVDEETEILTEHGWTRYHTDMLNSRILCYNKDAQEFRWEHPSYVHHYQYDDTAYRIQSDSTDQLVSRNHRCLIERAGALVFEFAENAAQESEIRVPILETVSSVRHSIPDGQSNPSAQEYALPKLSIGKIHASPKTFDRTKTNARDLRGMRQGILQTNVLPEELETALLQPKMQRESTRTGVGATRLQGFACSVASEPEGVSAAWDSESGMERRRNLSKAARELCRPVDQVCSLPSSVYQYGTSRWLRHGASITGRTSDQPFAATSGSGTSRRSRRDQQPNRKSRIIRVQPRSQTLRGTWISRTDLARITAVHYRGVMWCPTVPSGAFVARRHGQIFITGNSGFPKAADIGKLGGGDKFDGYKTALKPAYEPIVLARAPRGNATYAELAQTFGTGAINVNAGQIAGEVPQPQFNSTGTIYGMKTGFGRNGEMSQSTLGRYPANLIFDDSAAELLDQQSGDRKAGGNLSGKEPSPKTAGIYNGGFNRDHQWSSYEDNGGASRFFYTAKAPSWEREAGLSDWFYGSEHVIIEAEYLDQRLQRWVNAGQRVRLQMGMDQSQPKVIAVYGIPDKNVTAWNTFLFGSESTAQSLRGSMSIIEKKTNSITTSPILNFLTNSLTSESTQAALSLTEFGTSLVENAESSTPSVTIISDQMVYPLGVPLAALPMRLRISVNARPLPDNVNDGRQTDIDNAYQRGAKLRLCPHPTVKPIQLTEYLARLLLPPMLDVPRRILIPFAGVGSEMIGAQLAGWNDVTGIEREAEYVPINETRRKWWGQFKTYEQAQTAYRPLVETTDDLSDLPLFAAHEEDTSCSK